MADMPFEIRPLTPADRGWVARWTAEHWGAEVVVAHGVVYTPSELPGFAADPHPLAPSPWRGKELGKGVSAAGQAVGLVTYHLAAGAGEIVSLDSLRQGQGIGSALIAAVREAARQAGCRRLWLITTNDNLPALRFYQKRGFRLVRVHPEAVTAARRLKPEIPLLGLDGIPLRDELELEMRI